MGSSPGKCQIPIVFRDLSTDFTRSWWEQEGVPCVHPAWGAEAVDTVLNSPRLVDSTLSSDGHRGLGWPCCGGRHTAPCSSGLPPASWPVLHPLAPKGIWEGTWRTASGEQSCSQGRSSLLPCSCSLPPPPHVLRPVPPRPTCVQSFHSQPFVAPL